MSYLTAEDQELIDKIFDKAKSEAPDTTDKLNVPARLCFLHRDEFKSGVVADLYRSVPVDISSATVRTLLQKKEALTVPELQTLIDAFSILVVNSTHVMSAFMRYPAPFILSGSMGALASISSDPHFVQWMRTYLIDLTVRSGSVEKIVVPVVADAGSDVALIEVLLNGAGSMDGLEGEIVVHKLRSGSQAIDAGFESSLLLVIKQLAKLANFTNELDNTTLSTINHLDAALASTYAVKDSTGSPNQTERLAWLLKMVHWSATTQGVVLRPFTAPEDRLNLGQMWSEVQAHLISRTTLLLEASQAGAAYPQSPPDFLSGFPIPFYRTLPPDYIDKAIPVLGIQSSSVPFVSTASVEVESSVELEKIRAKLQRFAVDRLFGITKYRDRGPVSEIAKKIVDSDEWPESLIGKRDKKTLEPTVASLSKLTNYQWPFLAPLAVQVADADVRAAIGQIENKKITELDLGHFFPREMVVAVKKFYLRALKAFGIQPDEDVNFFDSVIRYVELCKEGVAGDDAGLQAVIASITAAVKAESFEVNNGSLPEKVMIEKLRDLFSTNASRQDKYESTLKKVTQIKFHTVPQIDFSLAQPPPAKSTGSSEIKSTEVKTKKKKKKSKKGKSGNVSQNLIDMLCEDDFDAQVGGAIDLKDWDFGSLSSTAAFDYGITEAEQNDFVHAGLRKTSLVDASATLFRRPSAVYNPLPRVKFAFKNELIFTGFYESMSVAYFVSALLDNMLAVASTPRGRDAGYPKRWFGEMSRTLRIDSDSELLVAVGRASSHLKSFMDVKNFPWSAERQIALARLISVEPLKDLKDKKLSKTLDRWLVDTIINTSFDNVKEMLRIFMLTITQVYSVLIVPVYAQISRYYETIVSTYAADQAPMGLKDLEHRTKMFVDFCDSLNQIAASFANSSSIPDNIVDFVPQIFLQQMYDTMLSVAFSMRYYQQTNCALVDRSVGGSLAEFDLINIDAPTSPNLLAYLFGKTTLQEGSEKDFIVVRKRVNDLSVVLSYDHTYAESTSVRTAIYEAIVNGSMKELSRLLGLGDGGLMNKVHAAAAQTFVDQPRLAEALKGDIFAAMSRVVVDAKKEVADKSAVDNDIHVSTSLRARLALRLEYVETMIKLALRGHNGVVVAPSAPKAELLIYTASIYVLIGDASANRIYWTGIGDCSPEVVNFSHVGPFERREKFLELNRVLVPLLTSTTTDRRRQNLEKYRSELATQFEGEQTSNLFMANFDFDKALAKARFHRDMSNAAYDAQGSKKTAYAKKLEENVKMWETTLGYLLAIRYAPIFRHGNKTEAIAALIEASSPELRRQFHLWKYQFGALSERLSLILLVDEVKEANLDAQELQFNIERHIVPSLQTATLYDLKKLIRNNFPGRYRNTDVTMAQSPAQLVQRVLESADSSVRALLMSFYSSIPLVTAFINSLSNRIPVEEQSSFIFHLRVIDSDPNSDEIVLPPTMKALMNARANIRTAATDALIGFIKSFNRETACYSVFFNTRGIDPAILEDSNASTSRALTSIVLKYIANLPAPKTLNVLTGSGNFSEVTIDRSRAERLLRECLLAPDEYFSNATRDTFRIFRVGGGDLARRAAAGRFGKSIDLLCEAALVEEKDLIFVPNTKTLDLFSRELDYFRRTETHAAGRFSAVMSDIGITTFPIDVKETPLTDHTFIQYLIDNSTDPPVFERWPLLDTLKLIATVVRGDFRDVVPDDSITSNDRYERIPLDMLNDSYTPHRRLLGLFRSARFFGGLFMKDHFPASVFGEAHLVDYLFDHGVPLVVARIVAKTYTTYWNRDSQTPILGSSINFAIEPNMAHGTLQIEHGVDMLIFKSAKVAEATEFYPYLLQDTMMEWFIFKNFNARTDALQQILAEIEQKRFHESEEVLDDYFGFFPTVVVPGLQLYTLSVPVPRGALKSRLGPVHWDSVISMIETKLFTAGRVLPDVAYMRDANRTAAKIIEETLQTVAIAGLVDFAAAISSILAKIKANYVIHDSDESLTLAQLMKENARELLQSVNKKFSWAQFRLNRTTRVMERYAYDEDSAQSAWINATKSAEVAMIALDESNFNGIVKPDVLHVKQMVISIFNSMRMMLLSADAQRAMDVASPLVSSAAAAAATSTSTHSISSLIETALIELQK